MRDVFPEMSSDESSHTEANQVNRVVVVTAAVKDVIANISTNAAH